MTEVNGSVERDPALPFLLVVYSEQEIEWMTLKPFRQDKNLTLWHGDARHVLPLLPDESAHCVVTSPPYFGLREYSVAGQIGQEDSQGEYVEQIVAVFRELWRVLRGDGTVWLNLGDSYNNTDKWGGGGNSGKHLLNKEGRGLN